MATPNLPGPIALLLLYFAGLMLIAAIAFIFIAVGYRGKSFIQGESPELIRWRQA